VLYLPTAVERATIQPSAAGFGARFAFDGPDAWSGLTLGIEVGRQFYHIAGKREATVGSVGLSLRF
jgi:hypothetical protein